MTLEDFKEQFKLTPEQEIEYQKQKESNLRKKNIFGLITKHSFGLSFVSLTMLTMTPIYVTLPFFIIFILSGLFFNGKYQLYSDIVHVNNMTLEDHYKFFEELNDDK